jgi:hypothetical protein
LTIRGWTFQHRGGMAIRNRKGEGIHKTKR